MTEPETTEREEHKEETREISEEARDRRQKRIVAVGFFLFFIILWLIIYVLNNALHARGIVESGESRFKVVDIPSGSSVSDIAARLIDERLISHDLLFIAAATARRTTRNLKAGEYRFDATMSVIDILSWLEEGRVMLHEFTIPEGYTAKHIARRLDQLGLADEQEFEKLATDPRFCEELGIEAQTIEGFLFPDTYRIARGLTTDKVIRIMVDRFWRVCSNELHRDVEANGLKLLDIVKIASIIEKEALFEEEMPLIADVIYNRMERKMPLQCDVTIRYPLDNYGIHLTYADLKMDSPYNTYIYPGLPPTPICNPGRAALEAALRPAETDYLYFVSMNNGRHKFSTSLKEHNKAVYKYQILQ